MKTIVLLLLFGLFFNIGNVESQEPAWRFYAYWTYSAIPNTCKKKADYGIVFIRKNKDFSNNQAAVKKRIKESYPSFIYSKTYDFTLSEGGVYKVYKMLITCGSEERPWIGYHILAGSAADIDRRFQDHIKNVTGVKGTRTLITGFVNSCVETVEADVVSYLGISMGDIGKKKE